MSTDIQFNSRTLNKLFPGKRTIEEKAMAFLTVAYSHNWSCRATARDLGISSHHTVKKLLEDIKNSPIYTEFLDEIGKTMTDFYSVEFAKTIFERYEVAYDRIEKLIKNQLKKGQDTKLFMELQRLQASIMKDQLRANMFALSEKPKNEKDTEHLKKFQQLYDELPEDKVVSLPAPSFTVIRHPEVINADTQ